MVLRTERNKGNPPSFSLTPDFKIHHFPHNSLILNVNKKLTTHMHSNISNSLFKMYKIQKTFLEIFI